MNSELKEWLGIAPADFPVYFAFLCVVIMYFSTNFILDLILSVFVVFCGIVACLIGMKKDLNVSNFTNTIKLFAYPMCFLFSVFLIALNFLFWNS